MHDDRPLTRLLRAAAVMAVLAWSLVPILLVVTSSFKEPRQIFEVPFRMFFIPTAENFTTLARLNPEFFSSLRNSIIVTLFTVLLTLCASFAAGYVYARTKETAYKVSAVFMLVVRMLPPIVVTVPLFPVVNWLALNDSHLILILLYAAFYVSLGSWMMRSFVAQIPIELEEAAALDGASLWQILRLVILPLAAQGLVALTLFVVVFAWNEYVFAMIFTTSNARTAPVVIGEMLSTAEGVQWGAVFAAATIQLVPVVLIVLALQRFLIAGLTAGAVKS
ncbi:carbohydrate ABC transporter permease [Chelatococcus asaccharovorans]|uniref:Multiple sugar transport system permease protein n=1 Tax=Chelatococcus asaccharovorans TaxID=28210 RepID=A0A2V3TXG4_9HYPH|nr:carbohydrate ABC transporter permease [Chelatococcus asaccharovorans]MBS7705052.1 carbohydrate ABC transporter permease [Chelatococcus asaccharovorans]PXW53542.1 multiple sugar transport system permease protein [Chelatococcus asaccharovorans]CAH1652114.1 Multiple sugar transport system permease protein [Chelatococcus asaccharovorans]CAH1686431.1 Multiple sugar transport system permease protein [Chelatococcus asaccharovorans]